jgi:hypothetical protein
MNSSVPYDNWPLFIYNPSFSVEVRETVLSIMIMAAVGSFFAWPMMISQYQKSQSALALVSLMLVITTTLVHVNMIFFDFRFGSLIGMYHNASELMFLLLAISQGKLRYWHLMPLGIYITVIGLSLVLADGYGFAVFSLAAASIDFLTFTLWILLFLENRHNLGTEGQRSGLLLMVIGSGLHYLGIVLYGSSLVVKKDEFTIMSSFLIGIFSVFYIHLTVFAVRILERAPYEIKWTIAWYKWTPTGLVLSAYAILLYVSYQKYVGNA